MKWNWSLPYRSQRLPVFAANMVTTSQPLAAQAGLQMLRQGGNAVDAALAAGIALTIVEPSSNGIGGDAFALIWDGKDVHGLNGSGRSPAGMTTDRFVGQSKIPDTGGACITVPGQVAAWYDMSQRFGKLPFADVFAPAIHYASHGFSVSPITAGRWAKGFEKHKTRPDFSATFSLDGSVPGIGDVWTFPDHALTLQCIAESGGRDFYEGELAARIAEHVQAEGGWITTDDMAAHRSEWVAPLTMSFEGCEVHEIPPNGQGLAVQLMLGIARAAGVGDHAIDSPASVHLQIESMKLAFADVYQYVADPACMELAATDLLLEDYFQSRAELIDPAMAGTFQYGLPKKGGTIYLSTADDSGMMVSYIQSNFTGFGSGVVVPGTGISLQNRGIGFTLQEGHPNQVGPNKRPYHTIIPGMVTKAGTGLMSFGVMGGPFQPQGQAQLLIRMLMKGQNPQAACDAPRWLVTGGTEVGVEPWMDAKLVAALQQLGHTVTSMDPLRFGGAQVISRLPSGEYCGASDPRKDGQAVGY